MNEKAKKKMIKDIIQIMEKGNCTMSEANEILRDTSEAVEYTSHVQFEKISYFSCLTED